MLSMGIKNSILVLLIVLILHVLIKNAIVDKKLHSKEKFVEDKNDLKKQENKPDNKQDHKKEVKQEDDIETFVAPVVEEKKDCKKKPEVTGDDDKAELLKFVYGDDDSDLSNFFKGMDVTKDVKEDIAKKLSCPVLKTDDNSLPLSTTCDPQLQKLRMEDMSKKVKYDCNLSQPIGNMLLKEYEDENAMNGGALFGDLSAYDDDALNFSEYECLKNT